MNLESKTKEELLALKKELKEQLNQVRYELKRYDVLSFEMKYSGTFLTTECFHCNLPIKYRHCRVLINNEHIGYLCENCVANIEKNPDELLPYSYANLPSLREFYREIICDYEMQSKPGYPEEYENQINQQIEAWLNES